MRTAVVCLCLLVGACASSRPPDDTLQLTVEVVDTIAHDETAFTQGLVLDGDVFYESTGRDTSLRRVDRTTGEVLELVDIDDAVFGEGLELVGDRLIQLTWRDGVAIVYDVATFAETGRFEYEGEGWGLCQLDDGRLVMSDGSAALTFRDPDTFVVLGSVSVSRAGQPVNQLNELECVGKSVWANVWQTNTIVNIDTDTGEVTAVVDAEPLDAADPAEGSNSVLNGIAYDPEAATFFLTGKEWSTLFEVRFVPSR